MYALLSLVQVLSKIPGGQVLPILIINISVAMHRCIAICYYNATIQNKKYIDFDNCENIWRV
jgi:hypothetical protein